MSGLTEIKNVSKNFFFQIFSLFCVFFSSYVFDISVWLRGIRQGQKLNQENDQQEETAQYQSQNIEFPNQENAYETPCQPTNTCETSQKQGLELAAYEEIKENRFKWLQYQNIGEDVYLTPVTQQKPLPSGN